MKDSLGVNLAELRKDKGKTQRDVAKELNLSKTSVGQYERNIHVPDIDTICILADYYDVSVDYLLGRIRGKVNYSELNRPFWGKLTAGDMIAYIFKLSEKSKELLIAFVHFLISQDRENT